MGHAAKTPRPGPLGVRPAEFKKKRDYAGSIFREGALIGRTAIPGTAYKGRFANRLQVLAPARIPWLVQPHRGDADDARERGAPASTASLHVSRSPARWPEPSGTIGVRPFVASSRSSFSSSSASRLEAAFPRSWPVSRLKLPTRRAKRFSRESRLALAPTFRPSPLSISASTACAGSSQSAPSHNRATIPIEVTHETLRRHCPAVPHASQRPHLFERRTRRCGPSCHRSVALFRAESPGAAQAESEQGQGSSKAGHEAGAAADFFNTTSAGAEPERKRCSACRPCRRSLIVRSGSAVRLCRSFRPRRNAQWNSEPGIAGPGRK